MRYREFLLKKLKTVTDQGGGPGGFGPSPPDMTLVWDWNSYIDRIVYHFLTGWFFLMKLALHFATKLNSWDIKKCNCFWVLSYDPFASAREAVFPAPTVTGVHRGGCSKVVSFTGASAYGKGPKNYNNVQPRPMGGGGGGSFLNQSFDRSRAPPPKPPPKKNFWIRSWKRWLILENTALLFMSSRCVSSQEDSSLWGAFNRRLLEPKWLKRTLVNYLDETFSGGGVEPPAASWW